MKLSELKEQLKAYSPASRQNAYAFAPTLIALLERAEHFVKGSCCACAGGADSAHDDYMCARCQLLSDITELKGSEKSPSEKPKS